MKKEVFAGVTIFLLAIGAVANILYLKHLVGELEDHVTAAESACGNNDFQAAEAELSTALQAWLDTDAYTHVFIRHSEIDSTADAFYEALECVRCEDGQAASSALEKLSYHLHGILTMEYVTLQSVF